MSDYGKKVGNALQAVRRMHTDASKLLQDCDGTIGKGKPSIYGSYVTRDLTYFVRATQYMASGLYRFYDASEELLGLVDGVTIYFVDSKSQFDEPLLIVGQVKYHVEQDTPVKNVSKEWDLWYAFFSWSEKRMLDEVLAPVPKDSDRIEWVKVIAVPLYDIGSMECVETLMNRVRQHSELGVSPGDPHPI